MLPWCLLCRCLLEKQIVIYLSLVFLVWDFVLSVAIGTLSAGSILGTTRLWNSLAILAELVVSVWSPRGFLLSMKVQIYKVREHLGKGEWDQWKKTTLETQLRVNFISPLRQEVKKHGNQFDFCCVRIIDTVNAARPSSVKISDTGTKTTKNHVQSNQVLKKQRRSRCSLWNL